MDLKLIYGQLVLFYMLCYVDIYLLKIFEDNNINILLKKILECKIIFPNYIKKDVKDLIKKILVISPEKRIDIKNIKKHPFHLKGKEIFENKFDFDRFYDFEKSLNETGKSLDNNKENER